jgi:ubiquinone/menaquinone biosynthesis C-methylase UbiE
MNNNAIIQKQNSVEQFWNQKPCDSDMSFKQQGLLDYYNEIEQDRYFYQGHINRIMDWVQWEGKQVLEIGTGVGTDARNIVRRGGIYLGINVDQGSVDATKKALDVFGLDGEVKKCSATELSLPDESVDIVYSFGVLHHIPDVEKAVSEIERVLKPGGKLLIMVYNRASINYKIEILIIRKILVRFLRLPGMINLLSFLGFPKEKLKRHLEIFSSNKNMPEEEWLSRNTDGPDNPYSLVYNQNEIEKLLHAFEIHKNEVFYFDVRHWGKLSKLFPKCLVDFLGKHYGWHRVVYATKPDLILS